MPSNNSNPISIGSLYAASHLMFVWDHPFGSNRVIDELPPEQVFMPIEKTGMFRSWFKVLYNDKIGWVNTGEADYKVVAENGG